VPSQNATDEESLTPGPGVDSRDLELLTQFLVGLLVVGGGEMMQRIREVRRGLAAHPEFTDGTDALDESSALELARYLAIGLALRGQARLAKGVRRGFHVSLGTASWALGWLDRATDNRLMRPVRRPVESRLLQWVRQTGQVIREGQLEEQQGKLLARETIFEIIDEVIEFVAENPEAATWIQEVIGGQSIGLATMVRDNARQMTVAGDGMAEGVVRRILRRTPRQALPPSPLAGRRQTMYAPQTAEEVLKDHHEPPGD
jgi:hypothetical protein